MTDDMIRACATALYYCKHYEDSNPDVGFGPFIDQLADRVLRTAEIYNSPENVRLVVDAYNARWGDRR